MNDKQKSIDVSKIRTDKNEKEAFVYQMNMRFGVIKHLMETLRDEIYSDDEVIEAKTILCALKLMMHLDNFVNEMHEIVKEFMASDEKLN